jgi:CubicO group peptidase (beta-lactamase class C family)
LRNTLSMCVRTVLGLICSARCKTVANRSLETLARERVFEPLGMHNSTLEWQERFATNHTRGHEWEGDGTTLKQAS